MSAVLKEKLLTEQQYLERERVAGHRSEFYRGETFAMAGGTKNHNRVSRNSLVIGTTFLSGRPCEAFGSDMRVKILANGLYTYPDTTFVYGKPEGPADDILTNPKVIFEVLSPSTRAYDQGDKFRMYRLIPSLAEYVMLESDEPRVEVHTRQADGSWIMREYVGLEAAARLESLEIELPMNALYNQVEFEAHGES